MKAGIYKWAVFTGVMLGFFSPVGPKLIPYVQQIFIPTAYATAYWNNNPVYKDTTEHMGLGTTVLRSLKYTDNLSLTWGSACGTGAQTYTHLYRNDYPTGTLTLYEDVTTLSDITGNNTVWEEKIGGTWGPSSTPADGEYLWCLYDNSTMVTGTDTFYFSSNAPMPTPTPPAGSTTSFITLPSLGSMFASLSVTATNFFAFSQWEGFMTTFYVAGAIIIGLFVVEWLAGKIRTGTRT